MLPRSALPAIALLTSFTLCAVILTYINPITTSSRQTHAFEQHSRAWWGTSRVAPSPTAHIYNANADGSSSQSKLNVNDLAPSLGSYQAQDYSRARQVQPQHDIPRRCKHTLGDWCRQALSINHTTAATPDSPGTKGCTAACNIVGNCNADTGDCDCPAGEATMLQHRPCHLNSALLRLRTLPLVSSVRITAVPILDRDPVENSETDHSSVTEQGGKERGACSVIQGLAPTNTAGTAGI